MLNSFFSKLADMQVLMGTFSDVGLIFQLSLVFNQQPHLLSNKTSKENLSVFSPLFSAYSKTSPSQFPGDTLLFRPRGGFKPPGWERE